MQRREPWLCPTALDRSRVVDANARVRTLRAINLGTLALALVIAVPWEGWLYVVLLAPVGATFLLVDLTIGRVERPERVSAAAILITLAVLATGVALDGGSRSPALPWLILPVGAIAARFRPQVVVVGLALSVAAILAATFGADPVRTARDPVPVVATLGLLVSVISIIWAIQAAELQHREAAVLDPLTSLLNRSSLTARFAEIAQQARLTGRPVCVLMCDIDEFKEINDSYGHDRGDVVLRDVAYEMRKQLRSFELIYRLGGEEFLVVLPGAGLRRGCEIAERLRGAIQELRSGGLPITISIGLTAARGEQVVFDPLFKAADTALYEAKAAGGNTVLASRPASQLAARA